jgi:hypothetical protein
MSCAIHGLHFITFEIIKSKGIQNILHHRIITFFDQSKSELKRIYSCFIMTYINTICLHFVFQNIYSFLYGPISLFALQYL